ncbi:MAG TPA: V-type ATP synthase subunit F [archaeon]|nr:V-type ATP synthase subunit F [archaeon]
MNISVIGDEHFVAGFNIAGISRARVVDKDSAGKAVEDAVAADNAVVITNKTVYDMLNPRMREIVNTTVKPTFVILSHDVGAEENLRMMIKRSLGIDLWKIEGKETTVSKVSHNKDVTLRERKEGNTLIFEGTYVEVTKKSKELQLKGIPVSDPENPKNLLDTWVITVKDVVGV